MSLQRFITAQNENVDGFETALSELRAGRKTRHWIWYIFPQLAGLGHSSTSRHFAIRDRDEACAYLRDSILRERLLLATEAVADQLERGKRIEDLLGGRTDALKLVSSMTLFRAVAARMNDEPEVVKLAACCYRVLSAAEKQGFRACEFTLQRLNARSSE